MAGFGSLGKIAMGLARNPKVREALNSPQAKQMGSKVVDRVAEAADKATKGKHQDKIQNARGQAHKHLGGPGDGPQGRGLGAQGPGDAPQDPGNGSQTLGSGPQGPGNGPQTPGNGPQTPGSNPGNPRL